MSLHYHVKCTNFSPFSFFHACWVPIRETDELRKRCVMGWILAQRGGRCSWLVAKNTGSMYLCRRWSPWIFAVTLLAWYSICHTSQLVLFRATSANPQPAFFRSHQRLEECNITSVIWKSCAFYKVVRWHFFQVWWVRAITKIIWSTRMYEWYCWKMTFWISQGKVATVYRWGGQLNKLLMSVFSVFNTHKSIKIGWFLT